jgi:ACS family tartrate transporter-like MFS transporter
MPSGVKRQDAAAERALAKATRRLIPFLFLLYVVAYLDRINVGFAALQMKQDVGLSDRAYGLGAGIFFVGYFLFEIPSNLILERVGARLWIARIMITWGVISASMMLVRGPASFQVLRFLLGVAEAGFFPGMILYLTYWFPAAERARTVARFMTATAIAGVLGGPISGALLSLHGSGGLAGWQWLFLVEGIPAVVLGLVVLAALPDRPAEAGWLTLEEQSHLATLVEDEARERARLHGESLSAALANPRVWLLALLYFVLVVGLYGVSLWLPEIVKGLAGWSNLVVGLVTILPYLVAAVAMVVIGADSDRRGERRWHVALPAFTGALGLVLASQAQAPTLALAALSLAALGIFGAFGPFWAMPTAFLGGSAAAGGIALINSIGNLGGFVGPSLIGLVHESTQSFAGGLLALAASLLVAGLLALCVSRASLAGSAPAEPGAGAAGSGGAAGAPTLAAGGASTGARSGVP